MLNGIFRVAGAMETAARNHEIASENLVHATTPGYRRQALLFESSGLPGTTGDASQPSSGQQPRSNAYTHFEPGPLQQTNNPLDVALSGNAFFVVQGPNGPLYTRNGSFERTAGGELRTRGGGYRVSGQGGPISIPEGSTSIAIRPDGVMTNNGTEIGRLQLATFARPEELQRVGPTLFAGGTPQTPAPDSVRMEQGYREGSNVQAVQEMTSMMQGLRYYEAAGKVLQALSDAVAQNTRPQ